MMMLFSYDENRLLAELIDRPTLEVLSVKLNKDSSVISRDLKRMSEKAPVIEKVNGRWSLTQLGLELALWYKKIAIEEREILGKDYRLTIATTREFASRILSKNFEPFLSGPARFNILTCENGIEEALLKGQADIGLDCGTPNDPTIAYKNIIQEDIVSIASPRFMQKKKIGNFSDVSDEDFIFYSRLKPLKNIDVLKGRVGSNDISVIRGLVLNHHGWATLPYYAVKEEIEAKHLSIIPGGEIKGYKFGVWWHRGRSSLGHRIKEVEVWLGKQESILKRK